MQYCLGIVCEQSDGQICINQRPFIDNLVRKFNLSEVCEVSTPADPCMKLVADDEVSRPADPKLYQQIVGSLQYAARGTRPDIAYAVSTIAKFYHQPTELHMTAAKCVLGYLKQTRDLNLTYVNWLLRCRLGRRRVGPTVNLRKRVPTRRRSHHMVQQETELGGSVNS